MESSNSILTTFGTKLIPINLKDGLFVLTSDSSVKIDTPLAESVGTTKTFKKGSVVNGTFWEEVDAKLGKKRKVVMVMEDLQGRYLIPKSNLTPTTQAEVDAKKAQSEVERLGNKVEAILADAKDEAKEIIADPKGALDKEYFGFTGKQLLVATLGVIVLIKVFK